MNRERVLKELEGVLESFLQRAVALKEERLRILGGINRLDDLAQGLRGGSELSEDVGEWFAHHHQWLADDALRPADRNRIGRILSEIKTRLGDPPEASAAVSKVTSEIDRWQGRVETAGTAPKLILKRGPEVAAKAEPTEDTIGLFAETLGSISGMFDGMSQARPHLLSVLDDCLKKADLQKNKDALILSGLIIYYLKQNGYKVEPYVKRLKEAEHWHGKGSSDA